MTGGAKSPLVRCDGSRLDEAIVLVEKAPAAPTRRGLPCRQAPGRTFYQGRAQTEPSQTRPQAWQRLGHQGPTGTHPSPSCRVVGTHTSFVPEDAARELLPFDEGAAVRVGIVVGEFRPSTAASPEPEERGFHVRCRLHLLLAVR